MFGTEPVPVKLILRYPESGYEILIENKGGARRVVQKGRASRNKIENANEARVAWEGFLHIDAVVEYS